MRVGDPGFPESTGPRIEPARLGIAEELQLQRPEGLLKPMVVMRRVNTSVSTKTIDGSSVTL